MKTQNFNKEPRLASYERKEMQYRIVYTPDDNSRPTVFGVFADDQSCLSAFDALMDSIGHIRSLEKEKIDDNTYHIKGTGFKRGPRTSNPNDRPKRTPVEFNGVLECIAINVVANRLNRRALEETLGVMMK